MVKKIFEAGELPEGERVYLKRGWFGGWVQVFPFKNEDGSINWKNAIFGGERNFIWLVIFLAFISFLILGVWEVWPQMMDIVRDPCTYCRAIEESTRYVVPNLSLP